MAHWFKFWTSAREDAKLRSLTDAEFRCWMMLLCLAAEDEGAVDMTDPDMVCIEIGLTDDDGEPCTTSLSAIVAKLERRRLVTVTDSVLSFNGWERRQSKPSDRPEAVRERKRRQRERERNAGVTRDVTPTEAEADTEADAEAEKTPREERRKSNLPACLSADSWAIGSGPFHSSAGHILNAIEAKHGLVAPRDIGLIGNALTSTCPDGCTGSNAATCAEFAIAKIQAAHTLKTAADWIVKDRGGQT